MKKPSRKFRFNMSSTALLFMSGWVIFVFGIPGLIVFVGAILFIAALEIE